MSQRIARGEGRHGWWIVDPRYAAEGEIEGGRRQMIFLIRHHPQGDWLWNHDLEKPTISPSYKMSHPVPGVNGYVDHFILTDGRLQFCGDSTHQWAGQTLALPPLNDAELAYFDRLEDWTQ